MTSTESSKEEKEMREVQAVPNNNPNICPHCGTNSDNQTRCCRKIYSLLQLVRDMQQNLKSNIHNFDQKTGLIFGTIDQDDYDAWVFLKEKADSFLKEHGGEK